MYALRLATAADMPAMLDIYRPYADGTTVSFEYGAPRQEEFSARLMQLLSRFPVLVCEETDAVCAYAYAAPAFERRAYAWCAELSVYVCPDCRGRGMGSALERAVAEFCRRLGYRKLYALVTEDNAPSISFHRAAGYSDVAFFPEQGYKMGKWLGVRWLEKTLNDGACAAEFPRGMAQIGADVRDGILREAADGTL